MNLYYFHTLYKFFVNLIINLLNFKHFAIFGILFYLIFLFFKKRIKVVSVKLYIIFLTVVLNFKSKIKKSFSFDLYSSEGLISFN